MINNTLSTFAGKPVIEIPAPWQWALRSWRERAFTWPWRPWQAFKKVVWDYGEIYEVNGKLLITPEAKRMIYDLIIKENTSPSRAGEGR